MKGCDKHPSFGEEGTRNRRFCSEHKQEGMVNVRHRRCEVEGCDRRPSFGAEDARARFCSDHKQEGMQNVANKRCEMEGCNKHPSFGDKGTTRRFCSKHKQEGMVYVRHKRCEMEGCDRQPSDDAEDASARFCSDHKQNGTVDRKNKAIVGRLLKQAATAMEKLSVQAMSTSDRLYKELDMKLFNTIPSKRKRGGVPQSVVSRVKERLDKLPSTYTSSPTHDYFWGGAWPQSICHGP